MRAVRFFFAILLHAARVHWHTRLEPTALTLCATALSLQRLRVLEPPSMSASVAFLGSLFFG